MVNIEIFLITCPECRCYWLNRGDDGLYRQGGCRLRFGSLNVEASRGEE